LLMSQVHPRHARARVIIGGIRCGSIRRALPHRPCIFGPRFGPPTPSHRMSRGATRQTVFLVRPYQHHQTDGTIRFSAGSNPVGANKRTALRRGFFFLDETVERAGRCAIPVLHTTRYSSIVIPMDE
jgi:hypothetical protein